MSFRDRLRIEWAVFRVDYALDGRVPRKRRRQIREELKSNVLEAAKTVGAKKAVSQLGDLHALATSYLELYRGRWDFQEGSWWAVITYALIDVVSLAVSFAFNTGVLASGGHAASYEFWSGFGPFAGTASQNSYSMVILSPAHLVLMALAFVVGSSRRLILRKR